MCFIKVRIPNVSLQYVVTPVDLTEAHRGLENCCWNNSTATCVLCSIALASLHARCMLCSIAL